MSKNVVITLNLTLADETDPLALADAIFDFLASDPEDLFPAIETVDGSDAEVPE